MNKLTIPEIAEALRQHINTDNDAKRLICEHVLPLVGLDVLPEEAARVSGRIETLETEIADARRHLSLDLDRYKDVIPEEALDALKSTLNSIIEP